MNVNDDEYHSLLAPNMDWATSEKISLSWCVKEKKKLGKRL